MVVMPYSRGTRGRRSYAPRPVQKTYKKVLLFPDVGNPSGKVSNVLVTGVDNSTMGQTSGTDGTVPTGSTVKFIEVQFAQANNTVLNIFMNVSLQYTLQAQSSIDPDLMGGNPQRNQTLHMENYSIGINQNSTRFFKFKIPKKFWRIKDDMKWQLVWHATGTLQSQIQVIYKVYM